jgi:hypothetical protein
MLFGEDEAIRQLKRKLQAHGCDAESVKKWGKQLLTVKRQLPGTWGQYQTSLANLRTIEVYMKKLQVRLSERKVWDRDTLKDIQATYRNMKKMSTSFDNEFVVSREDHEFHLIYDTICRLMDKFDGADDTRILLLSEVENILALIREKLDREMPDAVALSYFYLNHKDDELVSLPPESRLERITEVYENEFLKDVRMQTASGSMTSDELHQAIADAVGV